MITDIENNEACCICVSLSIDSLIHKNIFREIIYNTIEIN